MLVRIHPLPVSIPHMTDKERQAVLKKEAVFVKSGDGADAFAPSHIEITES